MRVRLSVFGAEYASSTECARAPALALEKLWEFLVTTVSSFTTAISDGNIPAQQAPEKLC